MTELGVENSRLRAEVRHLSRRVSELLEKNDQQADEIERLRLGDPETPLLRAELEAANAEIERLKARLIKWNEEAAKYAVKWSEEAARRKQAETDRNEEKSMAAAFKQQADDWQAIAEAAEAKLDRVRRLAQQWVDDMPAHMGGSAVRVILAEAGGRILAALDGAE